MSGILTSLGGILVPGGSSPSYTLIEDSFDPDLTYEWPVDTTTIGQVGINSWTSTGETLGKITFKLTKSVGDISGKTFTAKIYSRDGGLPNNLDTLLATSDPVTGDNSWNATAVDFIWSTPYTTSNGTSYHITLGTGSLDDSNGAKGYFVITDVIPGKLGGWFYTGVNSGDYSGYDMQIKLYSTP